MPKTNVKFSWHHGTAVTEITSTSDDEFLVTDKLADGTVRTEEYTRTTLRNLAVEHVDFGLYVIEVLKYSAE